MRKFKVTASSNSSTLKVTPYVINKGQSGEYYGLKNAEDNQVLTSAPNNWKSKKGAIAWAKKKGYEVVESACGKKSVKADWVSKGKKSKISKSFELGDFFLFELGKDFIGISINNSYPEGKSWLGARTISCSDAKGLFDYLRSSLTDDATWNQIERTVANSGFDAKINTMGNFVSDKEMRKPVTSSYNKKSVRANTARRRKSVKASSPNGYSRDERFALAGEVLYRAGVANQEHGAGIAYYLPSNYVLTFNSENDQMQSPDLIFTIWNPNAKDEFDYAGILYTDIASAESGTDATEALYSKGSGSLGERKEFSDFKKALDWVISKAMSRSDVNSSKKFGVKASKSAKKRVSAAQGYWADDLNAESYRKILQTLDDYLVAEYDGKTIGDVEIGVSELRKVKNGIGSKIEIMFYCPDYNKDAKFEIISAPELRGKFLGRVSVEPFKFNDEFMIRQSGCKQVVVDKINEVANMLSNRSIEGAKSIKCTQGDFTYDFSEDEFPFRVTSYYDHSQRGIADGASFDDMDEAVAYAHEKLSEGPVRIEHYDVGAVDINPDEYWENFDGEFWCTPELAEWRDEVWKSMGIGASTKKGKGSKVTAAWYEGGDIVMYFNGEKIYEGQPGADMYDVILPLCQDDETRLKFQEWCNQFGDPLFDDEYGDASETAYTFCELIYYDFVDDENNYEDGNGILDFEIFPATEEVTGTKSVQCTSENISAAEYNQMLADMTLGILHDDGYEGIGCAVTDEALSFYDGTEDDVVYIQPTDEITPILGDEDADAEELAAAVKNVAGKAVEATTYDDLEPITGEDEDYGYGFDSNGEAISESTVDELYRIAEREVLPTTELAKVDEYATIMEDTFEYYASSPYVGVTYTISATFDTDDIDIDSYVLPDATWYYSFRAGREVGELEFYIYVKDSEIDKVELIDNSSNIDLKKYDMEAIEEYVKGIAKPAAEAIYNAITNI